MPTAANLNLYRGWKSCIGWHRDDEPRFGECGEANLIVLVSCGSTAVFRWRRQSCPDDEGHLCWLGQGDILVMDGQCQDEFLHRTDPGREQERINVTFRWVKRHASFCPLLGTEVARCLPTCAQGLSVPVMENLGIIFLGRRRGGGRGLSSVSCVYGGGGGRGVRVLLISLLCTRLELHWCASCRTCHLGGGRLQPPG